MNKLSPFYMICCADNIICLREPIELSKTCSPKLGLQSGITLLGSSYFCNDTVHYQIALTSLKMWKANR